MIAMIAGPAAGRAERETTLSKRTIATVVAGALATFALVAGAVQAGQDQTNGGPFKTNSTVADGPYQTNGGPFKTN
jgi:hypothetical protein